MCTMKSGKTVGLFYPTYLPRYCRFTFMLLRLYHTWFQCGVYHLTYMRTLNFAFLSMHFNFLVLFLWFNSDRRCWHHKQCSVLCGNICGGFSWQRVTMLYRVKMNLSVSSRSNLFFFFDLGFIHRYYETMTRRLIRQNWLTSTNSNLNVQCFRSTEKDISGLLEITEFELRNKCPTVM